MNIDKYRMEAKKALSQVREWDVQAERAIHTYIDLLEKQVRDLTEGEFAKRKAEFDDFEVEVKRHRNNILGKMRD